MIEEQLTTVQKAFAFNMDPNKYGTIAEIGAGQEVSRCFFRAGGASGTIAKTISAYDMAFSDAIYGEEKDKRYVTESRLKKMLDKEFDLVLKRTISRGGHRLPASVFESRRQSQKLTLIRASAACALRTFSNMLTASRTGGGAAEATRRRVRRPVR